MSQSASGRHLRRVSGGNRPSPSPTMMASNSFSKSPRGVDRSRSSNDGRSRTSTDSSTTRSTPSNLTVTRPPSQPDPATACDSGLERSSSAARRNRAPSRSSNALFEAGSLHARQRSRKSRHFPFYHWRALNRGGSFEIWPARFLSSRQACFRPEYHSPSPMEGRRWRIRHGTYEERRVVLQQQYHSSRTSRRVCEYRTGGWFPLTIRGHH